ncbi:MAG: hypothetical protein H7839_14045 [Magnetococcus sp. YQC-5]
MNEIKSDEGVTEAQTVVKSYETNEGVTEPSTVVPEVRQGRELALLGERRMAKRQPAPLVAQEPDGKRALQSAQQQETRLAPVTGQVRKTGRELVKTGMVASLTTVLLTGFRVLRPLNPLHTVAGVLFVGFSLWHMMQNEKRTRQL